MRLCPYCAEEIQDKAKKCKHCGEWLEEQSLDPTLARTDPKRQSVRASESETRTLSSFERSNDKKPKGKVQCPICKKWDVHRKHTKEGALIRNWCPHCQRSVKPLKGVGGWLLFFWFNIMVFAPVHFIYTIAVNIAQTYQSSTNLIMDSAIVFGNVLYILPPIIFGIYAGSKVIREQTGAIKLSKYYLIFVAVWGLLFLMVIIFSNTKSTEGIIGDLFRPVIFAAIWYLYLVFSRRVKNTFPQK